MRRMLHSRWRAATVSRHDVRFDITCASPPEVSHKVFAKQEKHGGCHHDSISFIHARPARHHHHDMAG
jgi:hypothetical protein